MKLVIAVVNRDDASAVTRGLTDHGFSSTWLATSGGFLSARNSTMLAGVEAEQVEEVIGIIKHHCHSRTRVISSSSPALTMSREVSLGLPVEVKVGGAVIFVVDAEQFLRV